MGVAGSGVASAAVADGPAACSAVGVWLDRRPGETVAGGETLLTLHLPRSLSDSEIEAFRSRSLEAIRVSATADAMPLVHRVIGPRGAVEWDGWSTRLPIP